jgi:hypothetical protein
VQDDGPSIGSLRAPLNGAMVCERIAPLTPPTRLQRNSNANPTGAFTYVLFRFLCLHRSRNSTNGLEGWAKTIAPKRCHPSTDIGPNRSGAQTSDIPEVAVVLFGSWEKRPAVVRFCPVQNWTVQNQSDAHRARLGIVPARNEGSEQ